MRWYDRCWVLGGEVGDWRSDRGAGGGWRPLWLITLFKEPAPPNHLHGSTLQTSSATRDHTSTSPSVPAASLLHRSPPDTRLSPHTAQRVEQIASLVEYWCHAAATKRIINWLQKQPYVVMDAIMNLIQRVRRTRSIRGLNIPNAWLSSACKMYTFSCLITHGLRHEEDSLHITVKIAKIFHFEKWQSTQD